MLLPIIPVLCLIAPIMAVVIVVICYHGNNGNSSMAVLQMIMAVLDSSLSSSIDQHNSGTLQLFLARWAEHPDALRGGLRPRAAAGLRRSDVGGAGL